LNDATLNFVQLFVSLPAEILGLTLALIEIRFPWLAAFFRNRILDTGTEMHRGFFSSLQDVPSWQNAVVALGYFGFVWFRVFERQGWEAALILLLGAVFLFALPYLAGPAIRILLRGVLRLVSSFAPDREIGTLGIMVALVGVASESIQAATILRHGIGHLDPAFSNMK